MLRISLHTGRKTRCLLGLREIAWKLKSTTATVLFVGPSFPELKTLEKEITQIELNCQRNLRSAIR